MADKGKGKGKEEKRNKEFDDKTWKKMQKHLRAQPVSFHVKFTIFFIFLFIFYLSFSFFPYIILPKKKKQ